MILLPLDGSKTSLSALVIAKSISILLNLPLHILYVSNIELTRQELLLKLSLKEEDLPDYTLEQGKGDPAESIINRAKEAQYIVMCTHGETCDFAKIMGSISIKIIENVNIPILLVKPTILITLENNLWKPQKALIPLNGAPGSAQALIPAVNILAKTSKEINLLHISISQYPNSREAGTFTTPYYTDYPQHEWDNWAKEFLRRFCGSLKNHKNNVKINLHVSKGEPAQEIISFAKKNGNDLIAMAWHGRLGHMRAQVLNKVMIEAPCPVLLIKIR